MTRVLFMPLFLALFLLGLAIPMLARAETVDANAPLWKSIRDFEDKHAFDIYGPPLPQNAARAQTETRLYEDMVQYFDETAEDEPDFIFTAEAFSVPVESFRPEIIRPGEAEKAKDDPFGEDDPLPEAVQSTSAYVEEIRPTFLPGGPLKQRDAKEISLGAETVGSLFAESDRLKTEAKEAEKAAALAKPAETTPEKPKDTDSILASAAKKKEPAVGSNEETLMALKKAVHELGMERQLNFDGKNAQQAGTVQPQTGAGKQTAPAPETSPAPAAAPMDTAVNPAPAAPKEAAPPEKPKKKARKKKRAKPAPAYVPEPAPTPPATEEEAPPPAAEE